MSQQKPRQRGGRVLDKATPEQVMGLARNLPLTHSVLEKALADATPGQLGFLANLFEKENASRAESKRRRLLKQAGFPQSKTLEGYDRGMASFPADRGREQLESLEFVDRAEDLVLYGDVCFASMFVRQVRQCFSVVWADGFPRCRHRFPVM